MTVRIKGTGASAGAVVGPASVIERTAIVIPDYEDPRAAFADAVAGAKDDLAGLQTAAAEGGHTEAAEVLSAQALMADDPMLADAVGEALDEGMGLQQAVETAAGNISGMLAALDDEYLAARSADVLEVADRILGRLAGIEQSGLDLLPEPSVVVAATLTAAETSQLDPTLVLGFATEQGGPTGHVAVIARSLGIPAVVGAAGLVGAVEHGMQIALDGATGEIVTVPDAATLDDFSARAARNEAMRSAAAAFHGKRVSFGERGFKIAANVGSPADVSRAVDAGADGVGLYRTEFLFLDRSTPPSEEEQYQAYVAALKAFEDPVVVRLFDIGGDKPAPYLAAAEEENPFLGERGVRIYETFDEVFRSQVRALLRAATEGDLWIMVPMVATVDDLLATRRTIDETRRTLETEGVAVGTAKIGIMVEVPSAALIADRFAEHCDFFSIGTNDLTQYTLAADRTNGRLTRYADAAHPAVLRLCHATAQAAKRAGIETSVCGAAGGDPRLAILFAAMGITKLSVAPPTVNLVKSVIAGTDPVAAAAILDTALDAADAGAVRDLVATLDPLSPG